MVFKVNVFPGIYDNNMSYTKLNVRNGRKPIMH